MYQIDVTILNRALESPGRLNAFQRDVVCRIDTMRKRSPHVRLKHWERYTLKVIGRIFDIYPESFIPNAPKVQGFQNRERELQQSLTGRVLPFPGGHR